MSVFGLTIPNRPGEALEILEYAALSASIVWRKRVIVFALSAIFLAGISYVYFAGAIVKSNLERNHLGSLLGEEQASLQATIQSSYKSAEVFSHDYFTQAGYEESQSLGIIKRTDNVAEIRGKISFQYQ